MLKNSYINQDLGISLAPWCVIDKPSILLLGRYEAEQPENVIIVNQTRDIEAAHAQGKTAVICNSQTATILDGDLKKWPCSRISGSRR